MSKLSQLIDQGRGKPVSSSAKKEVDVKIAGVPTNFASTPFKLAPFDRFIDNTASYNKLGNLDLDSSRAALKDLQAQRDAAKQALTTANNMMAGIRYMTPEQLEAGRARQNEAKAAYDDLVKQVTQLQRDVEQAERIQTGIRYSNYLNEDDFEAFSQKGASIQNPTQAEAEGYANIFGWRPGAKEVENIVTYSRDNYESLAMAGPEANTMVGSVLYHYMTDDEVGIFNYLLAKEGEDAAQEYLDYLEETLNYRLGTRYGETVSGIQNPIGRGAVTALYGLGAGLDQFGGGARQLFSNERLPTSPTQYGSAYIRENLEEAGPELLGNSLGQIGYDTLTTTANMAPSILVSAVTGGLGAPAAAAAGAGAFTLGASASGNAYGQALSEGYTQGEARNYSLLVGASEAGLQYLLGGIGSLGGSITGKTAQATVQNIDNALIRVAADIGVHMAGEGAEEYLQGILEPAFRNLAFDENNEIRLVSEDAAYSFLLGAITAGLLEGRGIAITDIDLDRTGSAILSSGKYDTLLENALSLPTETEAYRMASRMKSGQLHASNINVGQLFSSYLENAPAEQSTPVVQTESAQTDSVNMAIQKMLQENGIEGTAVERQAAGVEMLMNGGEMSSNLANELRRSRAAQAAYEQMTGETLDVSGKPGEVRQRLKDLASSKMGQNVAGTNVETTTPLPRESEIGGELGDIARQVQSVNQVGRMAADSQVLGQAGKAAASAFYDGSVDPDVYYEGYMQAYNAGINNKRGSLPKSITKQQYNEAFRAGQLDAKAAVKGGGLVQNQAAAKLQDGKTIDALAKTLGVTVIAEETISGPDGRRSAANGYIKDGVIHIALDAADPAMEVFKHEVTHFLQERGAKEYTAFRDYAVQTAGEAEVERIQTMYRESGVELTREGAMDEVAANYAQKLLTDEKTIRQLIRKDRNLAQRVYDAIRDMVRRLTGKEKARMSESERMWAGMFEEVAEMRPLTAEEQAVAFSDRDTKYSVREKDPPKKTGVAYKVFFAKDGQLYPPMVANPGGKGTPVGVWLDADIGQAAPPSKTGRAQVQAGGKGTNAAKGSLAFRPGWHLGDIPQAKQFARKNPVTGEKDLFPADFVWAECEYAMDVDYQEEAMSYGYTENGKFRHSYAGLPKLPTDGYYRYRTNPNPDTVPWVITGAMKVNRILTDAETDAICREAGVEPMKRQGGPMDEARLAELGLQAGDVTEPRYSLKSDVDQIQSRYDSINARIRELSIQKSKLEDSTEFKRFMEAVPTLKDAELMAELERYSAWEKESGLSDVSNELKELRTQGQEAYRELQRSKENALNEAREEYRAKFDEEFSKKYASKAARKFGTTSRFDLAGYLTVNGTLLDFSERQGYRVQDHREIAGVLDFLPDYAEYSDGMIEFMNMGNIRLQSYGIDIAKAPNAKQRSMLRKFFNSLDGEVTVDFSRENGNNAGSIDYTEGTRADKILRDIDSYFSTGVVPEQSEIAQFHTMYSLKRDSQGRTLTAEQQEYFRDSKVRDDQGRLLVVYHGTPHGGFTQFRTDEGAFFTTDLEYARLYTRGNDYNDTDAEIYEGYLNITKPFDTRNAKERRIFQNEFYMKWGNGTPLSEDGLPDWTDGNDLIEFLAENGYDYDGIIISESNSGKYAEESYMALSPEQFKRLDNLTPTSDPDIRFSLKRENERLRELYQYLREEISDPSVVRTNRNAVKKLSGKLLQDYESDMDRSELTDRLMGLYDYIANGKDKQGNELTWTEVNRQANDIAQDILAGAVAQNNPLYEEYADVRRYVKSQKVVVPQSARGDFEQFGGWGEFRKRNFGRMNLANDGLASDVFYQELSAQWPELFPDDLVNPADQMIHTAEVLQYLDAVYANPYTEEMDVYRRYLADQILEEFYEVPERRTFAQRQEGKQTRQAIRYEKRIDSLRERQRERVRELRLQGRENIRKAVSAQKEQSRKKLEDLKKKYQSKESAARERREAAATRAKIGRHVKKLSQLLLRPSDKAHIPEALKKPVADLLSSINLESQYTIDPETGKRKKGGSGDPVKRTQAFQELRQAYKDIAESGEYLVDPDLQDNLDAVIAMKDKKLADMSQEELDKVWRAVRAMETSIQNANKLLSRSKFESVAALAYELKIENSTKREKKNYVGPIGKIEGLLNLDMLTPQAYFHRLGDAGDELFRMMRNAADRQTEILKEAQDKTAMFLDGLDARKLEKEMHTFRVDGETLELSTAQIMELYALSRRKQAIDHLYIGGIRPAGARKGIVMVGQANPVRVSPGDVAKIVSTLTDEQAKAVRDMQEYLSTTMAEHGNEASMRVYGYKKFLEKMYWPIRVDKNQTATDITKEGAEKLVPQYGMTKQVTPQANNALMIGSVFDTYAQHITEMSIYSAWLSAWEDASRVQNFVFRDPKSGARTDTVKTLITRVFGRGGNAYFTNLLKDVSQGTKANADTVFSIRGLTSAYKAAAVGANLRVILQQPTAGLRALDILDPKYILEGLPKKGDWETVKKWAPIAQWKDWGYFEMDTGRAIKDVLLGTDSVLDKVKTASMFFAGKADNWTWSRLWNACAAEIEDKRPGLKKGSETYYRAVAERFNQVIDQTQVVDSVLSRTQLMRSSSDLNKMAASFMSEPSKVYNMFLNAVYDLRAASSPNARVQARKRLGRTTGALVASFAVNAIAQSLIDAMRDDDREKKYWEKFAENYQKNFGANFNPVGYVPYLRDIYSLIQGYDVARMDMEGISSAISAINTAYKAIQGTGRAAVPSAFAGLFLEASRLLGVPAANLKRDIRAAFMTAAIQSDNYLMQYRMDRAALNLNYQGNTALFMDTLYNAMKTDREAYEIIYADLVKNGVDEDRIASAMESRMKADQGVESVDELERRYLPPAKDKDYQTAYNKISGSSLWAKASQEQRQDIKNDLYTLTMGNTEQAKSMMEDISDGAAYGVSQEDYLLWELAKELASQDGNGYTNQSEALEAAEMVPGLSNEAKAYLWKSATVTGDTPAWLDYEGAAGAAGIDPWEYILFHEAYYNASSTKDANGKTIEGQSKQDHVRDWLQKSDFTRAQQEFLWGTVYKSDY